MVSADSSRSVIHNGAMCGGYGPRSERIILRITFQFKGQFMLPRLVELEVQKPLNANMGFAGSQKDVGVTLRGGATQAEFLFPASENRIDYLKPVASPKKLN